MQAVTGTSCGSNPGRDFGPLCYKRNRPCGCR